MKFFVSFSFLFKAIKSAFMQRNTVLLFILRATEDAFALPKS